MTQTGGSKYVPGYDLFKLIVAVILTIILILLLLRGSQQRFAQLNLDTATPIATEGFALPTATSQPHPTSPPIPSPAPTEPIPTEPTPTEPASATTAAPTESIPSSDPNKCPSAPTRIHAGDNVRVVSWLYFRSNPGLSSPIILTNAPGTEMEVLGGPVCTIRSEMDSTKGYLWWYVRMQNGRKGWSAEAPLNTPNYLLEPVK